MPVDDAPDDLDGWRVIVDVGVSQAYVVSIRLVDSSRLLASTGKPRCRSLGRLGSRHRVK